MENMKAPSTPQDFEISINKFMSFPDLSCVAAVRFSDEH